VPKLLGQEPLITFYLLKSRAPKLRLSLHRPQTKRPFRKNPQLDLRQAANNTPFRMLQNALN